MENTYSITVTNKFSLALDEDEDPIEILKLREQEKEAKKKEKLSEKEKAKQQQQDQQHQKQNAASNKSKPRANKENQQVQAQPQQQQNQRNQDAKKDHQGEKKLAQTKYSGEHRDRNVKFNESREEHNNRRNREDGERPPRAQNDYRRGGPPGEGREPREHQPREQQPYREFRNSEYGGGERRGRGRGGMNRGRGGYRGGRGGGYDNRDKREYDRRSGSDKTGVKPIDKRDGAGSHNWGTHNDEIEESLNTADEWNNEKPEGEAAPGANDSAGSVGGAPSVDGGAAPEEKPVEEETRELTLDEYKALRQNRAKPQYNLRKAGEGEDLSRWKKMYALERKKEDNEEAEEEMEYDAAEYPQRVGRQKHLFDIEINFSDSRRSAGGRGGRGGRGRGERGGGRGFNRGPPRGDNDFRNNEQRSPRERQNAPKVDDEHDFPSLG